MNFSIENLKKAAQKHIISEEQFTQLQDFRTTKSTSNKFIYVLYYMGAFVIISAMTWLMDTQWDRYSFGGVFILTIIYILAFLASAIFLWKRKDFRTIPLHLKMQA